MSITFIVLRQNGQRCDRAPLTADDSELSLSNENAHDVLDALGIEDPYSSSPWLIAPFRAPRGHPPQAPWPSVAGNSRD